MKPQPASRGHLTEVQPEVDADPDADPDPGAEPAADPGAYAAPGPAADADAAGALGCVVLRRV